MLVVVSGPLANIGKQVCSLCCLKFELQNTEKDEPMLCITCQRLSGPLSWRKDTKLSLAAELCGFEDNSIGVSTLISKMHMLALDLSLHTLY